MAIITIPAEIEKGTLFEVTLDMSELLAEVSDAYFSVQANLSKVLVYYSSTDALEIESNQRKILTFDASIENPSCPVIFSVTSRDLFVVKKIKLVDNDGGSFDIPLKDIDRSLFEIDFSAVAPPGPAYITWQTSAKTGAGSVSIAANGQITKSSGGSGYNVNVLSNHVITGDGYFEFIHSSLFTNVVFGFAQENSFNGSFDKIMFGGYQTGGGSFEKVMPDGSYGGSVGSVVNGSIVRIERSGTTYMIKINGVIAFQTTHNNTFPLRASVSIYGETSGISNVTTSGSLPGTNALAFSGRTSKNIISFPDIGSAYSLLPNNNYANDGQGSFWSTLPLSGDFTFTASVRPGLLAEGTVQGLFGINDAIPANVGYGVKSAGWGIIFYNGSWQAQPWDVSSNQFSWTRGTTYSIEIKRVSGVVSYKVNNTTFTYTLNTSATLYLVGYLQVGSWEVSNAQLTIP